jgi:hypothetical protein
MVIVTPSMKAGGALLGPIVCDLRTHLRGENAPSALRDQFGEAGVALVADVADPRGSRAKRDASAMSTTPLRPASAPSGSGWRDRTSNVEEVLNGRDERFRAKSAARYLKWSHRVVDVCCRGTAPELEARCDRAAKGLEVRLEGGGGMGG